MDLTAKPKKSGNIVSRVIGEETVLVPVKKKVADLTSFYNLADPVSQRVWELMEGDASGQEILDVIVSEFDVEKEAAEKDLKDFLAQLEERKLIEA